MNVERIVGASTAVGMIASITTWWTRQSTRISAPTANTPRMPRIDDDIYEMALADGEASW